MPSATAFITCSFRCICVLFHEANFVSHPEDMSYHSNHDITCHPIGGFGREGMFETSWDHTPANRMYCVLLVLFLVKLEPCRRVAATNSFFITRCASDLQDTWMGLRPYKTKTWTIVCIIASVSLVHDPQPRHLVSDLWLCVVSSLCFVAAFVPYQHSVRSCPIKGLMN